MTRLPSKRSGGPRTEAGKAIASRNALKMGVYSRAPVLPSESEADFKAMEQLFREEYRAQGIVEISLAHDLAVLTWKRLRLEDLENRTLINRLEAPASALEWRSAGLVFPVGAGRCLEDSEGQSHTLLDGDQGVTLKAWMEERHQPQALWTLKNRHPHLFNGLLNYVRDSGLLPPDHSVMISLQEDLLEFETDTLEGLKEAFTQAIIGIEWVLDHQEAIQEAFGRVRDERLLAFMHADGPRRAHDDLARSFYRALTELRKQQGWRESKETPTLVG